MSAFPDAPMRCLLANCTQAYSLAEQFGTDFVGHIYSPGATRNQDLLPYALDNGAFTAWRDGRQFDAEAFIRHCEWAARRECPPLWVAVPDAVADADGTLRLWDEWADRLRREFRFPLAFVVQDWMGVRDVPPDHNVVFVGGTVAWKWRTVPMWCQTFDRVHVGRVNRPEMLWRLQELQAESCDGTGWFRGDKRQTRGLIEYLSQSRPAMQLCL